jgi:hypothetical protein
MGIGGVGFVEEVAGKEMLRGQRAGGRTARVRIGSRFREARQSSGVPWGTDEGIGKREQAQAIHEESRGGAEGQR